MVNEVNEMGSCVRIRKRLGAYLDGELNDRETGAVDTHVATCETCRATVEELRRLAPAMHAVKVPPVPPGLADQVMARARARLATPRRPVTRNSLQWWQSVSTPLRFGACATLLLAFLFGLTIGRGDFLSGNEQTIADGAAGMEGFEWFSQTPPASLGSTYIVIASNDVEGMNR
jgi:anti-sigma factor RsiW